MEHCVTGVECLGLDGAVSYRFWLFRTRWRCVLLLLNV